MNRVIFVMLVSVATISSSSLLTSATIYAENNNNSNSSSQQSKQRQKKSEASDNKENTEKSQERKKNFNPTACKQREKSINDKNTSISDRMNKQLTVIDKIFTRTQEFASKHQLADKTANYDALVNDARQKQSQAIDALKDNSPDGQRVLDCSKQNAKDELALIKSAAFADRDALKAYQSAVQGLISAVKSAATEGQQR